MEKDTLITAASLSPDPDEACASACYYVGWEFDHKHAVAEIDPGNETINA